MVKAERQKKNLNEKKDKKIKKKKTNINIKNQMQLDRLNRMKYQMEKYGLFDYVNNSERKDFILINIKDSKKVKVTVKRTNEVFCSCFDWKIRCKKNKLICKHICYILSTVLKLDVQIVKNHFIADTDRFNQSLKNITEILKKNFKLDNTKNLDENDLCAICFNDFLNDLEDNILKCGVCKGYVHWDCMECWFKNAVTPGCVYCKNKINMLK
jgi:hypothetical protein